MQFIVFEMLLFFFFFARYRKEKYYITSSFQIAIDVKTIIIGHVFIQSKFCVWGGEGTKFSLNNKYDQLLSFLRQNCYFKVKCTLLIKLFTIQILYFCFNFVDNL